MADRDGAGPGLAAARAHVEHIDGAAARARFTPGPAGRLKRGGPLHEVDAHLLERPPHWHLVTFGLSDLWEKTSDDPEVSGWGFELTLRLPARDGAGQAPAWASDLLTNLAAYVWQTGHDFAYGDHIDLRGPIRLGSRSAVTAAALAVDPALGTLQGPFGLVEFLQVVGLTADELELCRAWRTEAVLNLLAGIDPLLVTDPDRRSLLDDPTVRERAEAGIAAEGSSLDELRVARLQWRTPGRGRRGTVVELGSGAATALGPALRRKLNHSGATFRVVGDAGGLTFTIASAPGWRASAAGITVEVPLGLVDALAGLFATRAGRHELAELPGLQFAILP
jgi:suppressor of fused-like protein